MCLVLTDKFSEPLLASEDLVVYKVLEDYRHNSELQPEERQLITPYECFPVEIGQTYTSEFTFNGFGDVEKGLHSYLYLGDAINYIKTFGGGQTICVIAKCLIPKGSRYYQGEFHNRKISLASDTLTYLELIK